VLMTVIVFLPRITSIAWLSLFLSLVIQMRSLHAFTTQKCVGAHRYSRLRSIEMIDSTKRKKVVIVGATGYIGKYVTKESVRRGYETIAVVRPSADTSSDFFTGATIVEGDVTNAEMLLQCNAFSSRPDAVISCLASRSGVKDDSFLIDYQATLNSLQAAVSAGADHFVLLSAFCVRKPLLQFQKAKLKFEAALEDAQASGKLARYSIVRPTAFFKSVSGQFELVQQGWPFVMFGDGETCRCNPIAETDLAAYMLDCLDQPEKWNRVLNVGGPDSGLSMKEQGELLFQVLGKPAKFWKVPIAVFDVVIGVLAGLGKIFPSLEDAAELGRIGKYYAVEDMLTTDPLEKFGKVTLHQHYERIRVEGQEYDPYTTVLGSKK